MYERDAKILEDYGKDNSGANGWGAKDYRLPK